jgi:hypothetical protein
MLTFNVEYDDEARMFVASWDDPDGGGITTQAEFLRELSDATSEAVQFHFGARHKKSSAPRKVALHFKDDPSA